MTDQFLKKVSNALEVNADELEKHRNFYRDYEELEKRIKSLPDKLTHQVLVPIGPLAYIPGNLVRTNEIMVLLGDNVFAERSAKQTIGIIKRRQTSVEKKIDELVRVRNDLLQRAKLLGPEKDEFGNEIVEIREEISLEEAKKLEEESFSRRGVVEKEAEKPNGRREGDFGNFNGESDDYDDNDDCDTEGSLHDLADEVSVGDAGDDGTDCGDYNNDHMHEDFNDLSAQIENVHLADDRDSLAARANTSNFPTFNPDNIDVEVLEVSDDEITGDFKELSHHSNVNENKRLSKFKQARQKQREEIKKVPPPVAFSGAVVERDTEIEEIDDDLQRDKQPARKVSRFKAAMRGHAAGN